MIRIIISSLITTLFLFLFVILLISIIFGYLYYRKKQKHKISKDKKQVIINLKSISEDEPEKPFSDSSLMLSDVLWGIKQLIKDDQIEKVIIDAKHFSLSPAQVEDFQPLFKELNQTKEVIAYADMYHNKNYTTALLANKIYLLNTNNSSMSFKGYLFQDLYKKKLFDKLGINITPIHIGDYKVFGESFNESEMSDERKQSLASIGDDFLKTLIDTVLSRRSIDITTPLLEGRLLYLNRHQATDLSLVDGDISYEDLGLDDEKISMSIAKYIKAKRFKQKTKKSSKHGNVAMLFLEGTITTQSNQKAYISYENVKNKIDQIKDLDNLKGVVLRINSGGGLAIEAEMILRLLKGLHVPIYVSMGDYAASGGYYIACAGNKIFATANTITGSIGVVGLYPDFSKSLDKIGLNPQFVSKGEGIDYFNPVMPLSDRTKHLALQSMEEVYSEFKGRVSESRNIPEEELEKMAGGRVYSGSQAEKIGLIDEIGGLEETVQALIDDHHITSPRITIIRQQQTLEDVKNQWSHQSIQEYVFSEIKPLLQVPLYLDSLPNFKVKK